MAKKKKKKKKKENDVLRKEGDRNDDESTKHKDEETRKPTYSDGTSSNEFRKPLVVKKGDAKRAFDRRIDAAIGVLSTLNERTALLEKTPAKSRSTCVTRGVRVTASSSLIPGTEFAERTTICSNAVQRRIENEVDDGTGTVDFSTV